jgi:dipeptidyl aminopeptidase/acylaminoacyl peptidase
VRQTLTLYLQPQFSTPHFIVHNTLDYRLPESDGIALFNVLQAKGIPSRFLNFPDENHWVLNQENSLVWHTDGDLQLDQPLLQGNAVG